MNTKDQTPADLVRRAQAGDPGSREALARVWLTRVYAAALARIGNAADADDLTQEVFYRAFRALPRLRDPARFGPWLMRIVQNGARDRFRGRPAPQSLEQAPEIAGHGVPPTDEGALRAWRHLKGDQRLICWLKIMEGMRFRDIAELTGNSKSAVYRSYCKGLERLRREVTRC